MGAIVMILGAIGMLLGLVSLGCWLYTVYNMATDEIAGGIPHAIGGFICGLYALIWGWQNSDRLGFKQIIMVWTGVFIASIVLNAIQVGLTVAMQS